MNSQIKKSKTNITKDKQNTIKTNSLEKYGFTTHTQVTNNSNVSNNNKQFKKKLEKDTKLDIFGYISK